MHRWKAVSEIVRAFVRAGHPGFALLALLLMVIASAMTAGAVWTIAVAVVAAGN